MVSDAVCGASPVRHRRTQADMEALRATVLDALAEHRQMTVRQVFYQLVSRGTIEKTEAQYKAVCRLLVQMRLDGQVPFAHIADNTRFPRQPETFPGVAACLMETAQFYRRSLWSEAPVYVEIWCEKDALAGVIYEVTAEYDVPLMVSRGFASLSFLFESAEAIREYDRPAFLYYFGDHDPSGVHIDPSIERRLRQFAPGRTSISSARPSRQPRSPNWAFRRGRPSDPTPGRRASVGSPLRWTPFRQTC